MTELIIDFSATTTANVSLFTGRENGKRAKAKFDVKPADIYRIISLEDQLVTSSYFLGLLGAELKKFGSPAKALEHLDLTGVSKKTKDECERAVRRGLTSNRSLI